MEAALVLVRQRAKERLAEHSARRAEAIILRALVGQHASSDTLEMFREMYRRGECTTQHVRQPGARWIAAKELAGPSDSDGRPT